VTGAGPAVHDAAVRQNILIARITESGCGSCFWSGFKMKCGLGRTPLSGMIYEITSSVVKQLPSALDCCTSEFVVTPSYHHAVYSKLFWKCFRAPVIT
jgi:hypothetical protein